MAKFLGGTLREQVSAQINARSAFLKSDDYRNGLSGLHGVSTFINLYSSVTNSPYDSTKLALEGGLAFQNDYRPGDPVGYSRSVGDDQRSFTPRPGITDAKVKSKGTFGALRDVEVTVVAFNVGDFEMIYDLYCRPGFSFLLEWGHTLYINTDGSLGTTRSGASAAFLAGGATYDSVQKEITQKRLESGFNYDAMVAICKNFSWTFNTDGTYDINLSLISKGEVIESLKSSFDPNIIEKDVASLLAGNADKSERKSILHYFCKRMEMGEQSGVLNVLAHLMGSGMTPGLATALAAEVSLNKSELFVAAAPGFDIKSSSNLIFDDSCVFLYVSLRTILSLLNLTVMWKGKNQRAIKFKVEKGGEYNNYFTHPYHHSINPFVCVLPNLGPNNSFFHSKPADLDLHTEITNKFQSSDDILDICISNLYLYEKIDSIYDDDQAKETEPGVLDVMKAILGGVAEALGGINEFDLDYDEEKDEWSIVDRKCRLSGQAVNPAQIDLVGLGSFAYDIKTESKITNKLASQVSIAAQASGTGTKQNVAEMLQWNRGHYDRIFPRTNEGATQVTQDDAEALAKDMKEKAEWNDRCQEAFDKFNGTGMFTDQQYDPDLFKGIQSGHQKYQSLFVSLYCADSIPAPGTIPVELSFTLHGIGGFRIGETFKLSDTTMKILPRAYSSGNIGFIITKVDHSIGVDGWKTEIGALMYNLSKFQSVPNAKGLLSLMVATAGTAQPQLPPAPAEGSSDPAGTDVLQTQTALGTNVSYDKVKEAVLGKKYVWYSGELQLNIVGVRNSAGQISDGAGGVKHPLTNKFTDIVIVAWIENGQKFAESYPATTVPGASYSLSTNRKFSSEKNNPNGVGIMKEKQYINQYTPGKHHGGSTRPHASLNSVSYQTAHRDKNYSDNWLHLAVSPVGSSSAANLAGLFSDGGGMQIHNSGASVSADKTVDNWSAGCQVFANEKQHNRLMELVNKSQKATKATKFSYVLMNNKEIKL